MFLRLAQRDRSREAGQRSPIGLRGILGSNEQVQRGHRERQRRMQPAPRYQ
jgi:hypothetical protein